VITCGSFLELSRSRGVQTNRRFLRPCRDLVFAPKMLRNRGLVPDTATKIPRNYLGAWTQIFWRNNARFRAEFDLGKKLVCTSIAKMRLDTVPAQVLNYCVFGLEVSMRDYQIRILNQILRPVAFIEILEADDHSAIRSALRFSRGRPVEVWHDIDCVYRSSGGPDDQRIAA
jgi:hypothetical protein